MVEPGSGGIEPGPPDREAAPPARLPEEPTVGTGSAVAIGCVAATVVMMLIGIVIVLWIR